MIDKDNLISIKKKFSDAVRELRDSRVIPDNFVGKFQVNCNSGEVASVEANIIIK